MTGEERAEVLFTARLLRACAAVQWLAVGLTLVSVVSMRIAPVVLGLVATYYAVRVSLDARLFEDILAERLPVSDLDAVLRRKGKGERTMRDRCRGARRLAIALVVATLAQVTVLLVA